MRKRNNQVKLFLSDKEKNILDKKCKKAKIDRSKFLRKCIEEKEIMVKEELKEMLYNLKKIGGNINQMAAKANTTNQLPELEKLKKIQEIITLMTSLLVVE